MMRWKLAASLMSREAGKLAKEVWPAEVQLVQAEVVLEGELKLATLVHRVQELEEGMKVAGEEEVAMAVAQGQAKHH
jgi:hypothetical protein